MPIVLAKNSLSKDQLNNVVMRSDKAHAKTVYQVGYGVSPTVMHKIIEKMGLNR